MYTTYIQAPLHNLLLWLVSLTPGNSLALGILLFALLVKLVIFVFIYHGHVTNMVHHFISKHVHEIKKKHHSKSEKFRDELHLLYKHYAFNPWRGLFVTLIQFAVLFSILSFLYRDSSTAFHRLDIVTMDNVFVSSVMNFHLGEINLLHPLNVWWGLIVLGIVQFVALEIYLLTKRQLHRHPDHEEKVEHVLNLILTIAVVYLASLLPAVLSLYWFFFLLLGVLRKVLFSLFVDQHILTKLGKIEQKFVKKEEPEIRKIDEGILYFIWKIFNFKAPKQKFVEMKHRIEKKIYAFHHHVGINHSQRKIFEEPHLAAFIIFAIILLYLLYSSFK